MAAEDEALPTAPGPSRPLRLLIFQRVLTHYRLPLFNRIVEKGAQVTVLSTPAPVADGYATRLEGLSFRFVPVVARKWGPIEHYRWPRQVRLGDLDAIICELAAKVPATVAWCYRARRLGVPFFWWGHTRNYQGKTVFSRLLDSYKLMYARWGTGFLAYTEQERYRLIRHGFSPDRVVALGNTVDTEAFVFRRDSTTELEVQSLLREHGLLGRHVLGFVGRIYPMKRLEFALQTFVRLKPSWPELEFVIVGDGPQRPDLEQRYGSLPGVRFLGAIEDPSRLAPWLRVVTVVLNPGVVGLNLLQPFLSERPVITVHSSYHSPEFEYLGNGERGLITENNLDAFARGVDKLLRDAPLRAAIGVRARTFAEENLTMGRMAERLLEGVARLSGLARGS